MIECEDCGAMYEPMTDAYRCPECGAENYPEEERHAA
jgi:DNA-directed RNA polymerase subunit RPC12/RpoP